MRLIFDIAFKRDQSARNTFYCVDVSLALKDNVADFCIFQFIGVIGVIGDIVIGFKSLALDGTVGLYTYIFQNF